MKNIFLHKEIVLGKKTLDDQTSCLCISLDVVILA